MNKTRKTKKLIKYNLLDSEFSNALVEDNRQEAVNVDGRARICFAKQFNNILDEIFYRMNINR